MQEGDVQALGTLAGLSVNNATALLLNLVESVLNAILNSKRDVLNAAAAAVLLDELGDCALVARCLQKLDLGLANLENAVFTCWSSTSSIAKHLKPNKFS